MQGLSACLKLVRALAHAHAGWWTIRTRFPQLSPAQREAARAAVGASACSTLLGIRLVVQGTPPARGPVLLVANHLSWLDILAIHAARHVRFVSKADVQHWPLIGTLATGAGTLYIERERRRDAMRVVHHMTEALKSGDLIAVFPEGTTSDGSGAAALPRQPAAGRDLLRRAGAARRAALCRRGHRRDQPGAALHRRRQPGRLRSGTC